MCKEIFGLMGALGASASSSALGAATSLALSAGTSQILKYTAAAAVGGAVVGTPVYFWGKRHERNDMYDMSLSVGGLIHKDGPGCLTRSQAADAEASTLAALAAAGLKAAPGSKLKPQSFRSGDPIPVTPDPASEIETLKAEVEALKGAMLLAAATATKKKGK